jgi:MFS family permease
MNATAQTDEDTRPFAWFRTLGSRGRRAFIGAFGGYGLDSYDFQVLPLGVGAIIAYFGISKGEAGLLTTVTLVVSALGGALAGILADRIGRVRTLQLTVATYTVFTVLCGFASNFETLLILRALQGLGFGGEWAAGAILVAEYASPRYRGRTVTFVQSAWAVGWGLSVVVYTVVFSLANPDLAWRLLFWTGVIPALLVIWIRRRVQDADTTTERRAKTIQRGSFGAIFRGDLLRTTLFAALLATGVQGGYYTLASWLPTYLKTSRGLTVVGTGGYLAFLITGAFIGYVSGGYLTDLLGRKKTFLLFSVLSAGLTSLTRRSRMAPTAWSWCSGSRSASPCRRSSAASAPSSPSCIPLRCAEPGRASPTTSAVALARCSPPWWATWESAGRWSSAPSATGSPHLPCSDCPKPAAAN